MEIDKKNVIDLLYILKAELADKAVRENEKSFQIDEKEVSLRNLACGRSDAYQRSCSALDNVIRKIIEM